MKSLFLFLTNQINYQDSYTLAPNRIENLCKHHNILCPITYSVKNKTNPNKTIST